MRFLVDRCAGRRLTDWLRQQGHDVIYSPELGPDPGDAGLLAIAMQDSRVLITIDTDFGQLIFAGRARHAGLIRLPDVPAEKRIDVLSNILERYSDQISAGAVVTLRGNKIRVSAPPDSFA